MARSLGPPCKTCKHPKVVEIDTALAGGMPHRKVALAFGIPKSSMGRHFVNCFGKRERLALATTKPPGVELAVAPEKMSPVMQRVRDKYIQTDWVLSQVLAGVKQPDDTVAINAPAAAGLIRVALQALELEAKLNHELGPDQTVNVLVTSPEWLAVRVALAKALAPHPEAKAAVDEALRAVAAKSDS